MSKYARSGQYDLTKIVVVTNTSKPVELNLAESFTEAIVYESIFDDTMSGNISFVDTNGLRNKYALGNGETVVLEWVTAGSDKPIYCEGEVYDLTGPFSVGEHAAAYTIHWASPEFIAAARKKIFTGHIDTTANIVAAIHEQIARGQPKHARTKALTTTPTRGIEHLVFTGQTPLQAIKMCADRSASQAGKTGFIYFEDNQAFNFAAVEDLYAAEPIVEFVHKGMPAYEDSNNAAEESFSTYQDFEIEDVNKYLDDLTDGQYGSSWGFLSIQDKQFTVFNYDAKRRFDAASSLSKSPVMLDTGFNDSYSDKLSIRYSVAARDSAQHSVDNTMKLLKTNNFAVSIGAFGNSNIRVGATCKATIPTNSSDGLTPNEVDPLSGKFLIAEIKHVLTPKIYNQRIKIVKDGYEQVVA